MVVGLVNLGATCYMNAVLQGLFAVSEHLPFSPADGPSQSDTLSVALAELVSQSKTASSGSLRPETVRSAFTRRFPYFAPNEQQDAFEFASLLLDAVHQETATSPSEAIGAFDINAVTQEELEQLASAARGKSLIASKAQGVLLSKTEGACGCFSATLEPFFGLSLSVVTTEGVPIGNLEQAISEFQRPQALVGENRWKCGKCDSSQDAEISNYVFVVPEILIINLKRFRFTRRGGIEKLGHMVEYPAEAVIFGNNFRLAAAVLHGGSPTGGHYSAIVRDGAAWRLVDDQSVRDTHTYLSNDAYILFYQKLAP